MAEVVEVPSGGSDAGLLIAVGAGLFLLYEYEKGKAATTTTTTRPSTVPTKYTGTSTGGTSTATTTSGSSTSGSTTSGSTTSGATTGGSTTTTSGGQATFQILSVAPMNPVQPGGYAYVNVLVKNTGTATGTVTISGVSTNGQVVEGHFSTASVQLAPSQSKTVRMKSAGIVSSEFAGGSGLVYFAANGSLATVPIGAPVASITTQRVSGTMTVADTSTTSTQGATSSGTSGGTSGSVVTTPKVGSSSTGSQSQGASSASSPASASPTSSPPAAPYGLLLVSKTISGSQVAVKFTWSKISGAADYYLYVNGSFNGSSTTTAGEVVMETGQTGNIQVSAVNSAGQESAKSNPLSVYVPTTSAGSGASSTPTGSSGAQQSTSPAGGTTYTQSSILTAGYSLEIASASPVSNTPGSALVLQLALVNVGTYTTAAGTVPIAVSLNGSAGQQQLTGSIYVPQLTPNQGKTVMWTSNENLLSYQGTVTGTATSTDNSVAPFTFFLPLPSTGTSGASSTSTGASSTSTGASSTSTGANQTLTEQYQAKYQSIQNSIDNLGAQLDALESALQLQGVAPSDLQFNTQIQSLSSQITAKRQQKQALISQAQAQGISL